MKAWNKRPVAMAVLAVVVVLSVLVGSHRSVAALRQQTDLVFTQGERGDGLSIAHDLETRTELASNLIVVARRYVDAGDASLVQLRAAADALLQAESRSAKYQANRELDLAFQEVYGMLEGKALSQQDSEYRTRLNADFKSSNAKISHDSYNQLAQQFNEDVLGAFPGGRLAAATGVRPLELYR